MAVLFISRHGGVWYVIDFVKLEESQEGNQGVTVPVIRKDLIKGKS